MEKLTTLIFFFVFTITAFCQSSHSLFVSCGRGAANGLQMKGPTLSIGHQMEINKWFKWYNHFSQYNFSQKAWIRILQPDAVNLWVIEDEPNALPNIPDFNQYPSRGLINRNSNTVQNQYFLLSTGLFFDFIKHRKHSLQFGASVRLGFVSFRVDPDWTVANISEPTLTQGDTIRVGYNTSVDQRDLDVGYTVDLIYEYKWTDNFYTFAWINYGEFREIFFTTNNFQIGCGINL